MKLPVLFFSHDLTWCLCSSFDSLTIFTFLSSLLLSCSPSCHLKNEMHASCYTTQTGECDAISRKEFWRRTSATWAIQFISICILSKSDEDTTASSILLQLVFGWLLFAYTICCRNFDPNLNLNIINCIEWVVCLEPTWRPREPPSLLWCFSLWVYSCVTVDKRHEEV